MIRIIEAVQGYLKHLNESLVECANSASETARTLVIVSDAIKETTTKLVQLFDQQQEQNERINKYIWDMAQKERLEAKLIAKVDQLESSVRERQASSG